MLLGIDVGGTFTDAVVIDAGEVIAQAKAPTTHRDLLSGVLAAMDQALVGIDVGRLQRVALLNSGLKRPVSFRAASARPRLAKPSWKITSRHLWMLLPRPSQQAPRALTFSAWL